MSSKEIEVNDTQLINGKTWFDLKAYMVLMPTESWAEIKAFIIKICKKTGKCNGGEITNWERAVNTIDENLAGEK